MIKNERYRRIFEAMAVGHVKEFEFDWFDDRLEMRTRGIKVFTFGFSGVKVEATMTGVEEAPLRLISGLQGFMLQAIGALIALRNVEAGE